MKRLEEIVLVSIAMFTIFFTVSGTEPSRRGLVVNKLNGTVAINTHPQQPMELSPWQQPRLVIQMKWLAANKQEVNIVLSFLSLAKKNKLCAGLVVVNDSVIQLGQASHEYKVMKSGVWETVYVNINMDLLNQIVFVKMPLKFRVCGTEFYLHKYEAEDLKQAVELWRSW